MYKQANTKQSFPELEKEILEFWKENKTFLKSLEIRKGSEEFNFYDGPPFATGTPHYWHLVGGTLKDIIPRYQTMKGKYVERRFGWDCHGLPIENIVEKKLGISGKLDIENKVGVFNFNEECRKSVMVYVDEWRKTVERMGRWVDMDNDYKTMDADFMESVWWVFKSLFDKWYIYESQRVVPYCTRCSTPIANFEVNQGYEDKQDKSVTVKFEVIWEEDTYFLAWTTTPWTLPANLWLAVWKDIEYAEISDSKTQETYILAKDRLGSYYKNEEDYKILAINKGAHYAGIKYEPLFDFWQKNSDSTDFPKEIMLSDNSYSVVIGHHVTTDSWTWIVHIAPAYWEDDSVIGKKENLGYVAHIDDTGKVEFLTDSIGEYVFDFNEKVIKILKEKWIIINISTINHSYPHCYRCKTPLIYRGISAWYVKVEENTSKLIKNNEEINWVPENIKYWRFGNWLEWARDWNISRNRYWWSAMPIWRNEDKTETICIGSIEELYELNKDFWDITKVIFVRHWESVKNLEKIVDGTNFNKYKLTEKGSKQAQDVKELLKNSNIDVIYSSPFERALETISYFSEYSGLEVVIDERITELKHWKFEWTIKNDDYKADKKIFQSDNNYKLWWNWESQNEILERMKSFLNEKIKENPWKTIVVVTHWDPLYILLNDLCWKSYLDNKEMQPKTWSVATRFFYTDTGVEVDIHKHYVDKIKLKNPQTWNILTRIPEVLDCWFESGSMPYASKHYPFRKISEDEKQKIAEDVKSDLYNDILNQKTHKIIWIAMKVQNELGGWLEEKVYKKALKILLEKENFIVSEETKTSFKIEWEEVGYWKIDLVVDNEIVLELKSQKNTKPDYFKQLRKYLNQSDYKCWLLLNFYNLKLEFNRFNKDYQKSSNISTDLSSDNLLNLSSDILPLKYPWDFIAEWQDQTRWWFYTLLVLGTLLFDRTPFLNVIVNGTVLAEDGKKMSKSLSNYPDPELLLNKHWADALRFYMMNSSIVKADDLRFSEAWVEETVKKVILPLWNTYSFFVTYANIDNFTGKEKEVYKFVNDPNFNKLDLWILSELQQLIKNVSDGFEKYDINSVTRPIFDFMDNLTNWYIRRSRRRFWKSENDNDKLFAYNTLYEVLVEVTKVIAPIMPFVSEYIYKNLTNKESVHLEFYPELRENMILGNLNKDMEKTQKIVNLGLALRWNKKIRVRQPLQSITIGEKLEDYYLEIIKEELNVKEVIFMSDMSQIALKICKPNARLIGPRFGGAVQNIIKLAKEWLFEELSNGWIKVGEYELISGEFEIAYEPKIGVELDIQAGFGIVVAINTEISSNLLLEWYARDLVRAIQDARKEANYVVTDRISLNIKWSKIEEIISLFGDYIESETLAKLDSSLNSWDISKNVELDDLSFEVVLKR